MKLFLCAKILLLLTLSIKVYSQDPAIIRNIRNYKVSYKLGRTSVEILKDTVLPSTTVLTTNISDSVLLSKIKKISREQWLSLLKNPETDWASNLILYQVFDKDAARFRIVKNRKSWVSSFKQEDIEYWDSFLSDKL